MDQPPLGTAFIIWIFLIIPGVVCFCAVCAYFGLIKGVTITHFGIRSGVIARIYGSFYLLVTICLIFPFRFFFQTLASTSTQEAAEALLYPFRMPDFISISFIGIGVIMFLFWLLITRFRSSRNLSTDRSAAFEDEKKKMLMAIGLILLIGLLAMTDVPTVLPLALLLIYTYYGSIREMKTLFSSVLS